MKKRSPENFTVQFSTGNVDRENMTIKDIIIAEQIDAKDSRGIVLDDYFMQVFRDLTRGQEIPVKYNHQYYSQPGDKVGFISGVQFSNKKLIGDSIKLLASANKSPVFNHLNTPITDYILSAAEEHSKALMFSMSVIPEAYYTADRSSEVERYYSYGEGYGWRNKDTKGKYDGNVTLTPAKIKSIDIVGEGALTNSMYQTEEGLVEDFNLMLADPKVKDIITRNKENLAFSQLYNWGEADINFSNFFKKLKSLVTMSKETPTPKPEVNASEEAPKPEATTNASTEESINDQNQTVSIEQFNKLLDSVSELTKAVGTMQASIAGSPSTDHAGGAGTATLEASTQEKKYPEDHWRNNPLNASVVEKLDKEDA